MNLREEEVDELEDAMINSILENQTKHLNPVILSDIIFYVNAKLLIKEDVITAQGFHMSLWADVWLLSCLGLMCGCVDDQDTVHVEKHVRQGREELCVRYAHGAVYAQCLRRTYC